MGKPSVDKMLPVGAPTTTARLRPVKGIPYVTLHLRVENDWALHCDKWEVATDLNNCAHNTAQLGDVLDMERVPKEWPVYVATEKEDGNRMAMQALDNLASHGYCVVTRSKLAPAEMAAYNEYRDRERFAQVDYTVSAGSALFIGNSVSTFSALLHLQRRADSAAEFHYNGGNIPLEPLVPYVPEVVRPLKWFFAFATETCTRSFINDVKVAVISAEKNTHLIPVALVYGNANRLTTWLEERGVYVIFLKPAWVQAMSKLVSPELGETSTPNFSSLPKMVATWLRVEIANLPITDQYVLYTDVDVIFQQNIVLSSFDRMPETFSAAVEAEDDGTQTNLNMGIMLMNVPNLRKMYAELLKFSFAKNMQFGEYGPLDQGAFNRFFRDTKQKLPKRFNWKTYWKPNPHAEILHFHGFKYEDYAKFVDNGYTGGPKLYQDLFRSCRQGYGCDHAKKMYEFYFSMLEGDLVVESNANRQGTTAETDRA